MEKVEVSKEFVLSAHKNACSTWQAKIEKELPELFKKIKGVPGEWVKLNDFYSKSLQKGAIVRLVKPQARDPKSCWVVDHAMFDGDGGNYLAPFYEMFEKPTEEEIGEVLKKEAVKRGLVIGVSYKCVVRGDRACTIKGPFKYYEFDDALTDGYGGYVYKGGVWSTPILNVLTKKEAEEKLNCVIKG